MFNRLIDLLIEFISLFQVFVFVDEFEKGVILRQGRFHRTVGPGFRWILPLNQEDIIVANVKPEPMYLDVQSLHTADDYACNLQVGIIWRIIDIKKFIIDFDESEDILGMLCSGVVSNSIHKTKWDGVRESGYPDSLLKPMDKKAIEIGAEIGEVIIQDLATGSADRLWHEGISIDIEA